MMMNACIAINSGLVSLIEGLCAQILFFRFAIIGGFLNSILQILQTILLSQYQKLYHLNITTLSIKQFTNPQILSFQYDKLYHLNMGGCG